MKKSKKNLKVPFYAHLLSKQEMQNAGGVGAQTTKYPSDQEDTNPVFDQAQTQKYPSDQEDTSPKSDGIDV